MRALVIAALVACTNADTMHDDVDLPCDVHLSPTCNAMHHYADALCAWYEQCDGTDYAQCVARNMAAFCESVDCASSDLYNRREQLDACVDGLGALHCNDSLPGCSI